jgi:choline dehydrogenase-like flavoprotein
MTDTFDFVVVGGGSGGCTVTSRLTEDPSVSVAMLEAGGDDDNWIVNTPAALFMMVGSPINNWHFDTEPQRSMNNRIAYQPRGKGLGGSSAINAMVYIRGHKVDYDHWASLGNAGWSYADVLPYFRRSEDNNQFVNEFHGQGGPLSVSKLQTDNPIQQVFLEAARQVGYPLTDDFNGAQQEGIGLFQVTQKNGERWSAARGYIHPFMGGKRPNMRVETHAYATRILFDGLRAVGVEYRQHGQIKTLMARREVILSAGVFQTPQLLMLSGVGDAPELAKVSIDAIHHLPGVGRNLHDHPDFAFGYTSDDPNFFGASFSSLPRMTRAIAEYERNRRGPISSNFAEGGGFLKSRPDLDAPDLQLHFAMAMVDDHGRKFHWRGGFSCHVAHLRPKSRGSVWLKSSDPLQAPAIDPNFFDDPDDLETMVTGFKMTRTLMDAPILKALRKADVFTPNVHSDDDIRATLRARSDTVYHPVGTCKMGVNDPMAVVDPTLKVYGLGGLRIVDASIMPRVVGGNTNAATVMIGEKAADIIKGKSAAP